MKICVIGVGKKDLELSYKGYQKVKSGIPLFVRSNKLAGVKFLKTEGLAFESFDHLYESAESFDELNEKIAQILSEKAKELGEIAYLVDGSGAEDEALKKLDSEILEFYLTAPKAELARAHFAMGKGVCEISANEFLQIRSIGGNIGSLYISDLDSKDVASEVKLKLGKIVGDEEEVIFDQGGDFESVPLFELDRQPRYDENCGVFVQEKDTFQKTRFTFTDLLNIMYLLRAPNGCPWDRAQTHESIRMNAIEEAYEVAEAIDLADADKLREEVGDLMLQSVFHSEISEECGDFDINDVLTELCQKLLDRHTHVFGIDKVNDDKEALNLWENNKEKLKNQSTLEQTLEAIPKTLPSLMYAQKVAKKVAKANFDFRSVEGVLQKVDEELLELKEAIKNDTNKSEELGDVLFAIANVARFIDENAENALSQTSRKFMDRVIGIEKECQKRKVSMKDLTDEELDEIYCEVKAKLKERK